MKASPALAATAMLIPVFMAGCQAHAEAQHHHESQKIVATSPMAQDVVITQPYVCQIHSQRHVEVCALEDGYLEPVPVKEGQAVKQGDPLFKILPTLYQAELNAELAEVKAADVELEQARQLLQRKIVSQVDVALHEAKLAKAKAQAKLAEAKLNFTTITAYFDGVIDRLHAQQGSLVKEGDVLTTLSDNSVMWVYFNVPERRYLEYKAGEDKSQSSPSHLTLPGARIELMLADGSKFDQTAGDTVTVEGQFNNETGNIAFRADFQNPDRLLRHGQTGTVLIHRPLKNALVIPQRATFEVLDKQYVYVIGEDDVVHPREIKILHELEDVFVLKSGLDVNDKIVLDGVRQVRDGEKVEFEFRDPKDALAHQKFHAE